MNSLLLSRAVIKDRIVLETVGNAVVFLLKTRPAEALCRMQLLAKGRDWASFEYEGPLGPLAQLRLYSACSVPLGLLSPEGAPSMEELDARLTQSLSAGLLSLLSDQRGEIRFRVGPLRFGRWEIRDHLVHSYKWVNDPSDWQVNIQAVGPYLAAQLGFLHHGRRFARLLRSPASTNPVVAGLMSHLARPARDSIVCDAFCGTGTLLVEIDALNRETFCFGIDHDSRQIALARQNLAGSFSKSLVNADARALPLKPRSIDVFVSNLPFGKRSGTHAQNRALYPAFAAELSRTMKPGGKAVLLTEEKRLFRQAFTRPLKIIEEHMIETGGLHPSIFLVRRR